MLNKRSFRLEQGGSAFGGSLPLWESLELTLKSAYARKAKRQPSICFYTATTHHSEHKAGERSLGSVAHWISVREALRESLTGLIDYGQETWLLSTRSSR
jgi:hypothetical protein